MINVDPESECDIFYRYKMPMISIKIEGAGNGIKTILTNIIQVSKAICRKPEEIVKHIASSLGSNSICKTDKYIVNGEFTRDIVQSKIYKYITEEVLCPKCRNPETSVIVVKKTKILTCQACGNTDN